MLCGLSGPWPGTVHPTPYLMLRVCVCEALASPILSSSPVSSLTVPGVYEGQPGTVFLLIGSTEPSVEGRGQCEASCNVRHGPVKPRPS